MKNSLLMKICFGNSLAAVWAARNVCLDETILVYGPNFLFDLHLEFFSDKIKLNFFNAFFESHPLFCNAEFRRQFSSIFPGNSSNFPQLFIRPSHENGSTPIITQEPLNFPLLKTHFPAQIRKRRKTFLCSNQQNLTKIINEQIRYLHFKMFSFFDDERRGNEGIRDWA